MQQEYVEVECNDRIVRGISEEMNLPLQLIRDVVHSVSSYTADVIQSGGLEGVMIPFLGKFQVKLQSQQYKDYLNALGKEAKGYFKSNKLVIKALIEEGMNDES